MRRVGLYGALLALCGSLPTIASAHAFGVAYTLPLPVHYYIFGGVTAFIASCCVIFLFSAPRPSLSNLSNTPRRAYRIPAVAHHLAGGLGLLLLLLELGLCFFGVNSFVVNPAIGLFWIALLLGLTYVSVVVGGLYDFVNPFKAVANWLRWTGRYQYPDWLGHWPAVVSFFLLVRLELFSSGAGSTPFILGLYLAGYAVITLLGCYLFGARSWLVRADMFGLFFSIISKCAPIRFTSQGLELTVPGRNLLLEAPSDLSQVVFIVSMLSSTTIDGFKETNAWWALFAPLTSFTNIASGAFGFGIFLVLTGLYVGLYGCALACMWLLIKREEPLPALFTRFAYSLIPIAVAYHFAHYFTLVLTEGQQLVRTISDPLGQGANLFGTSSYVVNATPLAADTIWYIQLGVIVVGHIIAAAIAHRIAASTFRSASRIIVSQLPLLVLMVGYTALGLWILSRSFAPG